MELKLPDIGEGVHEGEIVRWLVKEGDAITIDQPIVEIMTDKATVELPSPIAGKIEKLQAKEGDVVKVGQLILSFNKEGQTPQSEKPKAPPAPTAAPKIAPPAAPKTTPSAAAVVAPSPRASAAPTPQPARAAEFVATPGQVLATPATRRLARDLGLDLHQIPATGPHGRVTKEDVQKQANGMAQPGAKAPSMIARPQQRHVRPASGERETLVPFKGIRRKIAEAMAHSRTTIAEFNYIDEADITELVALRKESKETAEKQGVKLTFLPFIIKALIRALKEFPSMNASLDEEGGNIILKNYYNIGIAVDTESGLVVPVVKDADQKSILEVAAEIQELADKARHGKLSLDEMRGATITITNPGPIGGLMTTPVINWPEVAILGVHKIVRRPIVKVVEGEEEIAIGDMMYLSFAVDHRVVDGATAARCMNVLIEYLSNPKKLLLDMA